MENDQNNCTIEQQIDKSFDLFHIFLYNSGEFYHTSRRDEEWLSKRNIWVDNIRRQRFK